MAAKKPVQFGFKDPLLVGVCTESERPVFYIGRGTDSIAVNALSPQLRFVGRSGSHCGETDDPVFFANCCFYSPKRLIVYRRGWSCGPRAAFADNLDRGIVDYPLHFP